MSRNPLDINDILDENSNRLKCIQHSTQLCAEEIISEIYKQGIQHIESANPISPIKKIEKILLNTISRKSFEDITLIRKTIIMKFIEKLPILLKEKKIPEDILKLYRIYMERIMAGSLSKQYDIDHGSYIFDIRFVMGLTIPCGAQVIELKSKIPIKSIIKALVLTGNITSAYKYSKIRGWGRWFRIHTDTKYLTEFNEIGWDTCYMRIFELLMNDRKVRGVVGTSWFYDPQLLNISPHLSYLQEKPLDNGAFVIRHGTGDVHTERALRTSKTRLQYYNEGKYMPTCYSLIWPRDAIINWCKSKF